MILPPTFLERSGTGLTPGFLITRFKEWCPHAPLELEKIKCTRHRCTDSRLSQVHRPALHQRRRSNHPPAKKEKGKAKDRI
jgi:hypothetical protein